MAVTAPTHAHPRLIEPTMLAQLDNLEFVARTVVEGAMTGLHRSPSFGFSQEFAEYSAYVPGDDLRYIDWNVFARSDRLVVKRFFYCRYLNRLIAIHSHVPNRVHYTHSKPSFPLTPAGYDDGSKKVAYFITPGSPAYWDALEAAGDDRRMASNRICQQDHRSASFKGRHTPPRTDAARFAECQFDRVRQVEIHRSSKA